MTLNTMLYDHVYEEEVCEIMSINDFGDVDIPLEK